ncbi:MAG: iron ABC transporter permease, partial [Pseudomonadota bacterium]
MISWRLVPFLAAALVLAPVGVIISSLFAPADDIWRHLLETTLPLLLTNTFWLALGVVAGTALLGISLAWFTAVYEFPGRSFFSWALLLPLAMPAYVTAFVALGLFDFTGPIQTTLRTWLDSDLSWFPDIRSRIGVIV